MDERLGNRLGHLARSTFSDWDKVWATSGR